MNARLLDMLQHARDMHVGAVGDRVDIDLDRVAQILVDQHRAVAGDLHRGDDIVFELGGTVDLAESGTLVYAFDVQRIREDYLPESPPGQPTVLVVVRNRNDDVAFMAITPLTYRLIELLKENPARTGLDAVDAIAAQFPDGERAAVREAGAGILRGLRERDVLLGTAPNS